MEVKLEAKGTVSECREKLNATLAALPLPETQGHKVIRMAAHYVVADYLDPIHDKWAAKVQAIRAANSPKSGGGQDAELEEPEEPKASFSITISIAFGS